VLEKLTEEIDAAGDILIILNQHYATISSYGYLPGLDMDSLQALVCRQQDYYYDVINPDPYFHILLVDTDVNLIYEFYKREFSDHPPILQHISKDNIQKDLDENRKWAELYRLRAESVLRKNCIKKDTVYHHSSSTDDEKATIKQIEQYIKAIVKK